MRIPIDITELSVSKHYARGRTGEPVPDGVIAELEQSARHTREAAEALSSYHASLAADTSRNADQRLIELRKQAIKVAEVQVSCWNRGRSVLNLQRWLRGAAAYATDLAAYRVYLINHEVGHGLGHAHTNCAGAGRPAGIMVQQTLGLGGCTAWPWPTHP